MNKNEIRNHLKQKRKNLPQKEVIKKSQIITEKILKFRKFENSKNILIYYPIQNEVDILGLVTKTKKNFYLPSIENNKIKIKKLTTLNTLKTGKYKIKEPTCNNTISINKIDLILIPGIAFDKEKNRIGFGKGFYDELLKSTNAHKIGISYSFQITKKIPNEIHDIKMNTIITENETL